MQHPDQDPPAAAAQQRPQSPATAGSGAAAAADLVPHPAARPAPLAAALRLLLPLGVVLLLAAVVLGAVAAGLRWAAGSEAGTRRVLSLVPGLEVQGLQGALVGGTLRAERLRLRWSGGNAGLEVEGLELGGIRWQLGPQPGQPGVWLALDVARAEARRLHVDTGPPAPRRSITVPDMVVPVAVRVAAASLAELVIDDAPPLLGLGLTGFAFDGRRGQGLAVAAAHASGHGLRLEASARIANQAPHAVDARATVTPTAAVGAVPPWAAVARASGPLATLDVVATLRGRPRDGAAAPQLDLEARIRPLDPWPLATLRARTDALDLSTLWPGAPRTALGGRVDVRAPAADAPVAGSVTLANARPGRWDEGRLPVAALELELAGRLDQRDRVEAARLVAQLADTRGAAGRVEGRARWEGHALALDARLVGVAPQRLDGRAAAMTLSGPLQARLEGVPSPDPAAGPAPPWQAALEAELEGRLDGTPTAVRVATTLRARDGRLELPRLLATAGSARAGIEATLDRVSAPAAGAAAAVWRLRSAGTLRSFDPLPWWPGAAGGAWRKGPHRLNADWQVDLRLPAAAARLAPLAWLPSLAGNGRLRLNDSLLAGVPLVADVDLDYGTGAGSGRGRVGATVDLGGNQLSLAGSGQPGGNGEDDRWRLEVQAPRLAALAPLTRLHPALDDWVPRQGRANGTLVAEGRWPRLATEGRASVEQLQAGTLSLQRGELRWALRLDEREAQAPLALSADVAGLALAGQRADRLVADLRGTLGSHRIELDGELPVALAPPLDRLFGLAPHDGTRVQLRADGRWQPADGGGARWAAHVEQLSIGTREAGKPAPAGAWFDARGLRAELQFDHLGALAALRADPGRVRLADGIVLRWDAVQADLTRPRADFELRADIEPFALAPLLARVQPDMGWRGDLTLAARVAIKAAERFEADLVFERGGGDLQLEGGDGSQPFGLSQFRLALTARDGVWDFVPQFSGRSLGEIRGGVRARTDPAARWPGADAPIDGRIQARVADIGIWSAWVPPGWRLAGELRTSASVGGRLGAPTYTGELTGSGIGVRSLLQGVNVSDGQLRVRLDGDSARIEQASARGGDGRVTVTGGALLGSSPSAQLQLVAERFRLIGRVDRQLTASGRADLVLSQDAGRLEGAFRVDEGFFDVGKADAPARAPARRVGERPLEGATGAEPSPRARRAFSMQVAVDLGEQLLVRGHGLDTRLAGSLRITNPAGRLAVNGAIDARSGTYAAYAQKLEIARGTVTFQGPPDNPRLDVLAVRPNIDQRVGVLISGSALAPRVRLWSEPDLPDQDKLSWLMLGRASGGLGRNDMALLQRAALALLAGEGTAPTDALLKQLGIDELTVAQREGDVRDTVITLGKQLSRRWFVGYERGVNATTGTWQLIYRAAQRLTVRAQSGLENSLDVIWVWRLQETPAGASVPKSAPALAR
ncbi:MAG: translocation/assembly module TamB domain-containing protein [Pseudomonadota bacterium]